MPDEMDRPDPYREALDQVAKLLSGMGSMLGRKITVEIEGGQHGFDDGAHVTGRLSSVELTQDGPRGGVMVWLSGVPGRLLIRRVVSEDACGVDNAAGPLWLN